MSVGTSPAAGIDPASETLAERYARMAHAYEGRPIDVVLRAMDIVIASAVLVLLGPLVLLVALATLITTGTPVLYRGDRVGRAGRVACILVMAAFSIYICSHPPQMGPRP